MGSEMRINLQSTVEYQDNLGSIRGISIVECKCKDLFRKTEKYLIAEEHLQRQKTREWVGESNIYGFKDANKYTINIRRPG